MEKYPSFERKTESRGGKSGFRGDPNRPIKKQKFQEFGIYSLFPSNIIQLCGRCR